MEKFSAQHGGGLKASDFAAYKPEWVKPIDMKKAQDFGAGLFL